MSGTRVLAAGSSEEDERFGDSAFVSENQRQKRKPVAAFCHLQSAHGYVATK